VRRRLQAPEGASEFTTTRTSEAARAEGVEMDSVRLDLDEVGPG
jgi:hypothetical protein